MYRPVIASGRVIHKLGEQDEEAGDFRTGKEGKKTATSPVKGDSY